MSLNVRNDMTEYAETLNVYNESGETAETVLPDYKKNVQIYGDMNLDDDLTVSDAVYLSRVLAEDNIPEINEDQLFLADIDHDGFITISDTQLLLTLLIC